MRQMKSLKLNHDAAQQIANGETTTTWRLFDDKDLSVNDEVLLIDKVDPDRPETWQVIGTGIIRQVVQKRLAEIEADGSDNADDNQLPSKILTTAHEYYGNDVSDTTV